MWWAGWGRQRGSGVEITESARAYSESLFLFFNGKRRPRSRFRAWGLCRVCSEGTRMLCWATRMSFWVVRMLCRAARMLSPSPSPSPSPSSSPSPSLRPCSRTSVPWGAIVPNTTRALQSICPSRRSRCKVSRSVWRVFFMHLGDPGGALLMH